ncbi:Uncharacterised protein [Mycobacteroides abscessus]|nr:Uncharacterised protein [Mycobacteroides abscessus]
MGLNQSRSKSRCPAAPGALTIATTAKSTSTIIWKPTRTYCTFSLVVMPRLEM